MSTRWKLEMTREDGSREYKSFRRKQDSIEFSYDHHKSYRLIWLMRYDSRVWRGWVHYQILSEKIVGEFTDGFQLILVKTFKRGER